MKHARLNVQTVTLTDLRPHPQNPRKHPDRESQEYQSLRASLENIYFDPLIWNKRNGLLVSGHLRHKVLIDMGVEKADVVVVSLPEKKHVQIMLRSNRNEGEWRMDDLSSLLKGMDDEHDRLLAGFTADDLLDLKIQCDGAEDKEPAEKKRTQYQCPKCGHRFEPSKKIVTFKARA